MVNRNFAHYCIVSYFTFAGSISGGFNGLIIFAVMSAMTFHPITRGLFYIACIVKSIASFYGGDVLNAVWWGAMILFIALMTDLDFIELPAVKGRHSKFPHFNSQSGLDSRDSSYEGSTTIAQLNREIEANKQKLEQERDESDRQDYNRQNGLDFFGFPIEPKKDEEKNPYFGDQKSDD